MNERMVDNIGTVNQVPLTEGLKKLKLKLQHQKSNAKEGVDLLGIAKKLSSKKFGR